MKQLTKSKNTSNLSKREKLKLLPKEKQLEFVNSLTDEQLLALEYDLSFIGRPKQQIPKGDWSIWLVLCGRGFGKSFLGSHVINHWARTDPKANIAIVGETASDIRDTIVKGVSGIIAQSHPNFTPHYIPSQRILKWPNGAQALLYSSENFAQLRGPNHTKAFVDELCKMRHSDEVWDMLMFTLRLGANPQTLVTTTPRNTKLIKELASDPETILTTGSTYENANNLSPKFIEHLKRKYDGTRLGKQEIEGIILDDNPNSIFNLENFNEFRKSKRQMPNLIKIVVALDPAVTNNINSDETGIIVAGIDNNGHGYVLVDASLSDTPSGWAKTAIKEYHRWQANYIVAEVNQGGDMVKTIMYNEDHNISFEAVRATKGKAIRAEPVAALYEQGRIHHVGMFLELEDQMASFDPTVINKKSPDRMDAVVWAFTALFTLDNCEPLITQL